VKPRDAADRSDAARLRDEALSWLGRAGRLIAACQGADRELPMTRVNLESLRHKRETLATKLAALDHHRGGRSTHHHERVRAALVDLRAAWATFVRTLERETGIS